MKFEKGPDVPVRALSHGQFPFLPRRLQPHEKRPGGLVVKPPLIRVEDDSWNHEAQQHGPQDRRWDPRWRAPQADNLEPEDSVSEAVADSADEDDLLKREDAQGGR